MIKKNNALFETQHVFISFLGSLLCWDELTKEIYFLKIRKKIKYTYNEIKYSRQILCSI